VPGNLSESALPDSYPDGHINGLAAPVRMYSRMRSGPSWSVERWKHSANYRRCRQSMAASACGMISRSSLPTVNHGIDFARHVLAEREAGRAVANSLTQAAARLRKVKRNRGAARSARPRPKP